MVDKIAHRGGYPQKENTLEAFQHCMDNKYCDIIELDVHLCKSNDIFVKSYMTEDLIAWCDGHVEAFKYFEGVPKTILYDNARSLVNFFYIVTST